MISLAFCMKSNFWAIIQGDKFMQSIMGLLPTDTGIIDQGLKGDGFVKPCTKKKEASHKGRARNLQKDLSIFNKY